MQFLESDHPVKIDKHNRVEEFNVPVYQVVNKLKIFTLKFNIHFTEYQFIQHHIFTPLYNITEVHWI